MKKYLLFLFLLPVIALSQVPVVTVVGPTAVCSYPPSGASFTAFATNSPAIYQWSVAPSNGVIIGNPTGSVCSFSFPYSTTPYYILCQAMNTSGPSSPAYLVVQVYETPTVLFSGNNTFCKGSSTYFQASPTLQGASSTIYYNWMPSTGLNNSNAPNVIANPSVSTIYTVQFIMGICSNSTTVSVIVDPCAGVKELNSNFNTISVYPNPCSEYFYIKSSMKEEEGIVVNELGQVVARFEVKEDEAKKIVGLRRGIYFVITNRSRLKIIIGD